MLPILFDRYKYMYVMHQIIAVFNMSFHSRICCVECDNKTSYIRQRSWANVMYSPLFVTLRNLRFSQSMLVTAVCMFVLCSRRTGHNTGSIVLILCQLKYSGLRTIPKVVRENRPSNFCCCHGNQSLNDER